MLKQLIKNHRPTVNKLSGLGAACYLKLNVSWLNLKIAHYDVSVDPSRREYNEHCIFVFWHEYILLAVGHWANTPVTMLVSQHRDADWLTRAGEHLGFKYVRGSTTRGGTKAIRELKRHSKTRSVGITPDGPRGPRRQMTMGSVFLASILKLPIVPVGFGYHNPWRLNTWDRFAVPKPGSRARIIMGPKIRIESRPSREKLDRIAVQIEKLTSGLTTLAEDWATSGEICTNEVAADYERERPKLLFHRTHKKTAVDVRGIDFAESRRAA